MKTIILLTLCLPGQDPDWNPEKTWVFAVGVLEWQDSETWASFPKVGRRDAQLVDLLRSRGVPQSRIVFLRGRAATRSHIRTSFREILGKAKPGDTLFLYYAGHGSRQKDGSVYFAGYDATRDVKNTAWGVNSIFEDLRKHFKGSSAFLSADCCYSGELAIQAKKRKSPVSFAVLTSSLSRQPSTGNWTFTECLLNGFQGGPNVDLNGDGWVSFSELGKYTEEEMAFTDGQLSSFATTGKVRPGNSIAKAKKKRHERLGERLQVEWQGKWYNAKITAILGPKFNIHYVGWSAKYDEWVTEKRMRPWRPANMKEGTAVMVEWKKKWYPAKVLDARLGLHYIHYDNDSSVWDEWVGPKRIRRQ